ncbi:MAG: response regulator transcription factor [Cyclobacteriaceae bacterium]|nr:response regulator transcription factor [Cyclobacteriaceae bacterium]
MKLLIVEDEMELVKSMVSYFTPQHYTIEVATQMDEALEKILMHDYDCVLLDINLPDGSGLRVLEKLKQEGKMEGVIIISARNAIEDRIKGLDLGADDYLTKPFHLAELGARVSAVVRRKHFAGVNLVRFEEIEINMNAKEVTVAGEPVILTPKELNLLLFLLANKNRVISKSAIAEHLSGDEAEAFDNFDFIYAHIKNLKRKLTEAGAKDYIKTVYGLGYRMEAID